MAIILSINSNKEPKCVFNRLSFDVNYYLHVPPPPPPPPPGGPKEKKKVNKNDNLVKKNYQEGGGGPRKTCTCIFFYNIHKGTEMVTSPLPLSPKSILQIFT